MALASPIVSTLDQILDATDRMLEKYGMKRMTMEDIAVEAGISRRTIYEYFPSKKDLVLASIDRVVTKAHVKMTEDASTEFAAPERLYRMLCSRVMIRILAVQDITKSLDVKFAEIRPAYMLKRHSYFQTESEMVSQVIKEGQMTGAFGGADALDTATHLVRATNAYLPYSLSVEELGHPEEIRLGVEKLAAILVSGISK